MSKGMGVFIIFAEDVSNEKAFLLQDLCKKLNIDYFSDWANDSHTAQYCAVGPVTKGDKDQVCSCLSGCKYTVLEAQSK